MYCDIPQTDYAFCVVLLFVSTFSSHHTWANNTQIFTYILTLIFATIRILSFRYTRNSLVEKYVMDAEEKGRNTPSESSSSANSSLHRTPSSNTNDTNPPSPTSPTSPFPSTPGIGFVHLHHTIYPIDTSNGIEIDIEAQTARISNGSRGGDMTIGGPPPHMPNPNSSIVSTNSSDSNAAAAGNEEDARVGSTIPEYGKDQEFPGLQS